MKLLLTDSGVRNASILAALVDLLVLQPHFVIWRWLGDLLLRQ
jgi:hypothetical protein